MPELVLPLAALRRVELPVSAVDRTPSRSNATASSPLSRWGSTVAAARDACLVLDAGGRVVSVSPACAELFGQSVDALIGRDLLDAVALVDFETGEAAPEYAARIPPLLVLTVVTLGRSLLRLERPAGRVTLDIISAPLRGNDGQVVGSISFLAEISPG
ncbi:MAG TPA: PAS domain-containing protein [Mycobacteriales bacterium]|nr:PAS domain-containing protein [Mycobacteriales bacterium]